MYQRLSDVRNQLICHGDIIQDKLPNTDRLRPQGGADLPPDLLLSLEVPELQYGDVCSWSQQLPQPHLPRPHPGDPGPASSVSFSSQNIEKSAQM